MKEERVLTALNDLKKTTTEISQMLQILLYRIFGEEPEEDKPEDNPEPFPLLELESIKEKYERSYLG